MNKEVLLAAENGDNTCRAVDKETINAYKKAHIMIRYKLSNDDMALIEKGKLGGETVGGEIMHELMQKTTQDIYRNLNNYYEEGLNENKRAANINFLQGLIQDKECDVTTKVNVCKYMLRELSFCGIDDDKKMTMDELNAKILALLQHIKANPIIHKSISSFRANKAYVNVNEQNFKNNLLMINGFLQSTLGVTIRKTGRHKDDFHVPKNIFIYDGKTKTMRLRILDDLVVTAPAINY